MAPMIAYSLCIRKINAELKLRQRDTKLLCNNTKGFSISISQMSEMSNGMINEITLTPAEFGRLCHVHYRRAERDPCCNSSSETIL